MKSLPLTCLLVIVSSLTTVAEEAADTLDDDAAIRANAQAYADAYNKGDATALAAFWSEDAIYVNRSTGERVSGRAAIEEQFESLFAEEDPPQIDVVIDSIQFITDDVAVEEGTAHITQEGEILPYASTYVVVHVKRDDQWLIESIREADYIPENSNYDHLSELEWMVGEWVDQDEHATVQTACRWSKNQNYLTRSFSVSVDDRIDLEGIQIIGWDPAGEHIRSWTFDSDGGFSSGIWSRVGDSWRVEASGVLSDGRTASAIRIISYIDENSCTWHVIGREVDGEIQPDIDEFSIVRLQADE